MRTATPALPDSRRLEDVIHSDGIAQRVDTGAQPHPHCQTATYLKTSSTATASLSCGTEARSQTRTATHRHLARTAPWGRKSGRGVRLALSDSRRLEEFTHSDSVAQLLDMRTATPALPHTRRHEGVTHSDGVAQPLGIGAQPHTHCQTAADLKASPTVTAPLSCGTEARSHTRTSTHRHVRSHTRAARQPQT